MTEAEQNFVWLPDCEGNTIRLLEYEENFYAPPVPNSYRRLSDREKLVARKEDIWIIGYPKSGTHWLWDILQMLLAGSNEPILTNKQSGMVNLIDRPVLDAQPSPRVINCHIPFHHIPPDILKKESKIIYLIRNPKDVAVSLYHHTVALDLLYQYRGTWPGFISLFIDGKVDGGKWFDDVIPWWNYAKTNPNVLVLKYEDIKKDPFDAVSNVAQFIGKADFSITLLDEIVTLCDFKVMKERKREATQDDWAYRKGVVGDWKSLFTVGQSEAFDELYKKEMIDCDLKVDFE